MLQILVILVGGPLSFWFIESILGSGPVLALVGIAMAILGYREGNSSWLILGVASVGFAAFIFGLINANSWGPPEAAKPVRQMIVAFSVIMLPSLFFGIIHRVPPEVTDDPDV
ncbi:MAG: hypothetical protein ACR2NZ_23960 [Rubripirellula sp.]